MKIFGPRNQNSATPAQKDFETEQSTRTAEQKKSDEQNFSTLDTRAVVGYLLGGACILAIAGLGCYSFCTLHELSVKNGENVNLVLARLGGHALITLALVYFLYQLLRAAERMILPYWWAGDRPEIARIVLGIADPISTASRLVKEIRAAVQPDHTGSSISVSTGSDGTTKVTTDATPS